MTGCSSGTFRGSLGSSVATLGVGVAAHSCFAGRSSRCLAETGLPPGIWGGVSASVVVHGGQAPAPAGELAGHRDRADGGSLAAAIEPGPALVQPPIAPLGAVTHRGRLIGAAADQLPAGLIPPAVMPRRFDQQPPGVTVPVLVIPPWVRRPPLECSVGTNPR